MNRIKKLFIIIFAISFASHVLAKDAGTDFEFDWIEKLKVKINVTNINLIFFILTLYIIDN